MMAKSNRIAGRAKTNGTARASKARKSDTAGLSSTKSKSAAKAGAARKSASRVVEDWRGEVLARVRELILVAEPDVVEEVKWRKPSNPAGVPVWSHKGIICTGETYKDKVKLTFAYGASLPDPTRLFNSSLEGNTRRAIDIYEGEEVDARAFKALVRAAVAHNVARMNKRKR
jgi:hypothetical protein